MKFEYLIFNLIVISGPFLIGRTRRFDFRPDESFAQKAVFISALPFLVWDALVAGRHWFFNAQYVTGVYFWGLPLEEILFFFTVPYACLFTWSMIGKFLSPKKELRVSSINYFLMAPVLPAIYLLMIGLEYTALALINLAIVAVLDLVLKTRLYLNGNFYLLLGLTIIFTLIFNGYLTARPVVTYGMDFQTGWRIFTIPAEDFIYGISLISLNTIIFEKLKKNKRGVK